MLLPLVSKSSKVITYISSRLHVSPVSTFDFAQRRFHEFPLKKITDDLETVSYMNTIYSINKCNSENLKEEYSELARKAYAGGGEKGIHRHVVRNRKVLVRERLKKLLDKESPFLELCLFAGLGMEYGDVPCAGQVGGIGKINGVWCMISANDATVKSGAVYPITLKKQLRCQQIAEENFLPTVYLVDSGGAFLPLQAEIFNLGGKAFYNEAVMSSKGIPQIALICGSCTAGGAYVPTMAEESVIIDKIGTIFLGGPPLVLAATGENVTPEELGGAMLHCNVSGCTDHFAENEEDSLETVRDIIATSNLPANQSENKINIKNNSELQNYAPASPEYSTSIYSIIKRIADCGFHEYKKKYASALVTGFAFVDGNLVGIIANNGYLTAAAGGKGCNFVQLCDRRQIPILFLQNITHDEFDRSETLQTGETIRGRAQLLQAIVLSEVPKIVISIGGLVGSPHMHPMCSLSLGARFHFVWPNVKVGSLFIRNLHAENKCDYEKLKKESSAFYGASRIWFDDVILPESTKQTISYCLDIFKQADSFKAMKLSRTRSKLNSVIRM